MFLLNENTHSHCNGHSLVVLNVVAGQSIVAVASLRKYTSCTQTRGLFPSIMVLRVFVLLASERAHLPYRRDQPETIIFGQFYLELRPVKASPLLWDCCDKKLSLEPLQ